MVRLPTAATGSRLRDNPILTYARRAAAVKSCSPVLQAGDTSRPDEDAHGARDFAGRRSCACERRPAGRHPLVMHGLWRDPDSSKQTRVYGVVGLSPHRARRRRAPSQADCAAGADPFRRSPPDSPEARALPLFWALVVQAVVIATAATTLDWSIAVTPSLAPDLCPLGVVLLVGRTTFGVRRRRRWVRAVALRAKLRSREALA